MNLIKVNTVPTIFNRMDNIIDSFFSNHAYNKDVWTPNYDIDHSINEYKILMEVPGIKKGNVNIEHQDKMLTVSGKKESKDDGNFSNFQYREFEKEFNLPEDVIEKDISAHLENGILEIKIPRKAEVKTKAKKVTIK